MSAKKNSASLFPWIVLLKMVYKKKWKIQKFKKLRMNDVKKCDVIIWYFGVKINANLIGSIFYIFRASLA